MIEVPLVYPNNVYKPRRYAVESRQLRRVDTSSMAARSETLPPMDEALPGAASVSTLHLKGKDVIVTTSARLDCADILSIALSWTKDALESPVITELDCRGLEMEALVAVRAFAETGATILITLVDSQGTFATIKLTERLEATSSPIQILKKMDYIEEIPVLQLVDGSEVQPNMVAFVSAGVVIMALSPFILTVDLKLEESAIWSETQCLEDMKSRSSSLKNILSNVSELVLGKLEVGVMDMPTTAALCLTSSESPFFDPIFCITLHSDASIRKWKIEPETSLLPSEVTTLNSKSLSMPSSWSDTSNSVALCARLYQQTFALAVHIRTDAMYSNNDEKQHACNLWVFHGSQVTDPDATCMRLDTPEAATSLVGMNFVPTQKRCSLAVTFESATIDGHPAPIRIMYPPSIMSIVSPQPVKIKCETFDDVALVERTRIQSMMLGSEVLDENENATVDKVLHEIDSLYMKYLFRPMFPRGTGTVLPPSEVCIRRALAKMVHGHTKERGMSLELETIRCMSEWRERESRAVVLALTPNRADRRSPRVVEEPETALALTSPFSVYESYVLNIEEKEETLDECMHDANDSPYQVREEELPSEIEAHERRWRRFLLQVWEEEQNLRSPLKVCWLESVPIMVTVRAGITTAIEHVVDNTTEHSTPWAVLDNVAVKLLHRIENDEEMSKELYKIELDLVKLIASARLATSPINVSNHPLIQKLIVLARWTWLDGEGDEDPPEVITDDEHERLEHVASSLSPQQLVGWILNTPIDASGTLPCLDYAGTNRSSGRVRWNQSQIANAQLRHAACNLSVRCTDTVRRLQLGRCLLVLDLVEGSNAREAALRAYLHTIAVLWTAAQRVPMPSTALQRKPMEQIQLDGSPETTSPPKKRLSFGDGASGILAPDSVSKTTILDVSIIEISQTMDESFVLPPSPIGAAVFLGQSYFQSTFYARKPMVRGGHGLHLRDLCALPSPKNENTATDYPRLALRLLAPCVALLLPQDSLDVAIARKETMAECLLIESHSESLTASAKADMRLMACELLVPRGATYDNPVEQQMIQNAFYALESIRQSLSPNVIIPREDLARVMAKMAPTATMSEIFRLCELPTVKKMFAPLATVSPDSVDDVTKSYIAHAANAMLYLSRVMHRITILERHVGVRGLDDDIENSTILLEFLSSAIMETKKMLSEDIYENMDEYIGMWSGLFHHSVFARQWRQAYAACVKNPKSDRRENNFKQLVRAMVDSGALCELLNMCSDLVIPGFADSESVDLYEVASEILAEAISRDYYTLRAASPNPSSLSDFQGALYALHASQKQWRRAAQSMDLRYTNARIALAKGLQEASSILRSAELRDGIIVDDIVLASVAAVNALELVNESAHRFLVSGEYGPYNIIPFDRFDETTKSTAREKRNRGSLQYDIDDDKDNKGDRLSKFMTCLQLEGRAIRCSMLRVLYFDRSSDRSFTSAALLRNFDTSKDDIEELFRKGYFHHGLLLAKTWAKNYDSLIGSSRPGSQRLFYDTLSHMLEEYVIPLAAGSVSRLESSDSNNFRPLVQQLTMPLEDVGTGQASAVCVVPDRCCMIKELHDRTLSTAAMAVARKFTLTHSTAENSLAIDVAACFLSQDEGCVTLPTWLERLLTGADISSTNHNSGLFARRPKPGSQIYLGDPAVLVSLYSKHGMLAEACDLVTSVLLGLEGAESGSRESNAPSRLPEKGDVDFVAYQPIDTLWNLVEICLSSGQIESSEAKRMQNAREKMESALEKHFALMKISEMGMKSARALKRSTGN